MKKLICLMAAIAVCVVPSFAWSAESFLGNDYDGSDFDDQEYYDSFFEFSGAPMMFSAAPLNDVPSGFDSAEVLEVDLSSCTFDPASMNYMLVASGVSFIPPSTEIPFSGTVGSASFPLGFVSSSYFYSFFTGGSGTLSFDGSSITNSRSYDYLWSQGFVASYDVPVDGSSSSIEFDFNLDDLVTFWYLPSEYFPATSIYMNIIINDNDIETFAFSSGESFSRSLIFNFTEPITSCRIEFVCPSGQTNSGLPSDDIDSGSVSVRYGFRFRSSSYIKYSLITSGALDGFNDQTQDSINDHNAIESEWTGSMTSNFDALNLATFEYPSELVTAFALLSGIFNDLWMGMGEYRILYVLPLILGVILVIIGKMSRTERRNSSSVRGDPGVSLVVRDR